jgi:hypothetical protein
MTTKIAITRALGGALHLSAKTIIYRSQSGIAPATLAAAATHYDEIIDNFPWTTAVSAM